MGNHSIMMRRYVGDKLRIGDHILLEIKAVSQMGEEKQVTIGVEAPRTINVIRAEHYYHERVKPMKECIEKLKAQLTPLFHVSPDVPVTKVSIKSKQGHVRFSLKKMSRAYIAPEKMADEKEDLMDFSEGSPMVAETRLKAAKASQPVQRSRDVKKSYKFCHTGEKS